MFVVTICGSMRFKDEMQKITGILQRTGEICVLQPCYADVITPDHKEKYMRAHFKRIEMSDAVYIVNCDGYTGFHTKQEMDYAASHNVHIIYHNTFDGNEDTLGDDVLNHLITIKKLCNEC